MRTIACNVDARTEHDAFAALVTLAKEKPESYRAEMQRMWNEEPARLDAFVAWFQAELEKVTRKRRHSSLRALMLGQTPA